MNTTTNYEAFAGAYAAASVGSWSIVHSITVLWTLCDFYFGTWVDVVS